MPSLHAVTVPVFIRSLEALAAILGKAEDWCAGKKIDPAVMTATRLIPDMLPLARQVQIACDFAKNGAARLAGVEAPKFEDGPADFAQLKSRIADTLAFVKSVDAAALDAGAGNEIVFPVGPNKMKMPGEAYMIHFVLPNFHFHFCMAYAILRESGLDIGKRDFMGAVADLQPA